MPLILDDLSLKIRPGRVCRHRRPDRLREIHAASSAPGALKSRRRGAIYYDGKDLERIDLRSLRRRIGAL